MAAASGGSGAGSCFVLGASGATGRALLRELQARRLFARVTVIGRRRLSLAEESGTAVEQVVVDFERLSEHAAAFRGHDVGFCCLGTTRSKAGTDGFVRVDRDYVAQAAELAWAGGCKHFVLQSSQGANEHSRFLYLRVKGEVEKLVRAVGFDRCTILRPAVLLCTRQEFRPMEWITQRVLGAVAWLFPTAYSVPVETVARAMVASVLQPGGGKVEVLENKAIHQLGKAQPQLGT
ncbi:regulator of G-protein signaling 5 isoform X3 [Oxyura jamaicensis]|uniref:regulator of G-protein signaling 5 isoform X3 n=1 Tax=Oxyura jamaicensis TaxID=8884 RepID=UPI0015A6DE31|nr:regulator of G-protein signaling 5 isoform X3 [Oxyura jamaicensis]